MNLMNLLNGRKQNSGGFLLISSYMLIMVMEIFSLALFSRSHTFVQSNERNKNKIVAFNMAEAGIDNAIAQLAANSNYAGSAYGALGNNGGYQIWVCSAATSGSCNTTTGNLTVPVGANLKLVQATGYAPNNAATSPAYETRTIYAYMEIDNTPFEYGVFGDTSTTFTGNANIDSYNSATGNYGGANAFPRGNIASDGAATLNGNANVIGNLTAASASLNGNARVAGTATTTTGTVSLTGNAQVAGGTAAGSTPNFDCSAGTTSLPNLGTLNIQGNNTLVLAAGTYHYSSLSIAGNGRLSLAGPTTIYVDGTVSVSGNGISTASNIPTNLMIIATGTGRVDISGNGDFYGAVYAPDSQVKNTGNGKIFGAVIADVYNQSGNGDVHFDEALKNTSAPCSTVEMQSYREIHNAAS